MTPPVVKRASAHGALLIGVVLTSLTAAALFATLAGVGGGVLARSVVQRLAATNPAQTSIVATGPMTASSIGQADAALRGLMRATFGRQPFAVDEAETGRALELPAAGGSAQSALIAPTAVTGIQSRATLTAGAWPAPPRAGQPIEIALPAGVARTLALGIGSTVAPTDSFTGTAVRLRVSGLYQEDDPASPYWRFSPIGPTGVLISGDATSYGPVIADPAAFASAALNLDSGAWVVRPDLSRLPGNQARPLASAVSQLQATLSQSPALITLAVTTDLPRSLDAAAGDAWAARSALSVATALSALLALAALLLAVRLLRSRREIEAATVRARGGLGRQLIALNAAEALACGLIAAAGGAYGAAALGAVLAPAGTPLAAPDLGTWLAAAAAALVGTLIMAVAAVGVSSPVEAWVRRSRQSTVLALARVGGDVAVVALAGVAVWQLREITLASTTADGIDPVLVLAPALALAGATLMLIRLVPMAARLAERWAGRRRGLLGPLVTWDVSRRPSRFTGAMLLSVLAVATGVFALTMHASWHRSQLDQAAFQAGSDVRVEMVTAAPVDAATIAGSADVTAATPVASSSLQSGTAVAVNADSASAVALRPDLSQQPVASLWNAVKPSGKRPGLDIPGTPARISISASLTTDAPGPGTSAGVDLTLVDADGAAYRIPADALPADGRRHDISALINRGLPGGAAVPREPALYPLRLVDIVLTGQFSRAAFSIAGAAAADSASGPPVPFATGQSFSSWWLSGPTTGAGTPTLASCSEVLNSACAFPATAAIGAVSVDASSPPASIPALATTAFLKARGARIGTFIPITVNGAALTVRLAAEVHAFPTLGDGPVVVLDLGSLQSAVLASGSPPVIVNEWLLRTRDGAVPPGLPAAATVISRSATANALLNDPLGLPSQRAWIVIALAAAVLAVLGGGVNVAAELRSRRRDTALLAALGVSRWQQLRGLCLERLVLGVAASGLGLLFGAVLSILLVAPVTPSTDGTAPVPPVLVTYVWPWSLALAAVVALGPVAAVAASTLRRPDAASELRLVEAM
ncbi:MAG TPA: ABC transporter permease [Actinocrinis sp.]|nr:ABC transporter permease [Actinocrinis sp.]